jgi:hypothetical protein
MALIDDARTYACSMPGRGALNIPSTTWHLSMVKNLSDMPQRGAAQGEDPPLNSFSTLNKPLAYRYVRMQLW